MKGAFICEKNCFVGGGGVDLTVLSVLGRFMNKYKNNRGDIQ